MIESIKRITEPFKSANRRFIRMIWSSTPAAARPDRRRSLSNNRRPLLRRIGGTDTRYSGKRQGFRCVDPRAARLNPARPLTIWGLRAEGIELPLEAKKNRDADYHGDYEYQPSPHV